MAQMDFISIEEQQNYFDSCPCCYNCCCSSHTYFIVVVVAGQNQNFDNQIGFDKIHRKNWSCFASNVFASHCYCACCCCCSSSWILLCTTTTPDGKKKKKATRDNTVGLINFGYGRNAYCLGNAVLANNFNYCTCDDHCTSGALGNNGRIAAVDNSMGLACVVAQGCTTSQKCFVGKS